MRKPWCTSNSLACALLNVPRIPKPAHLRRASILHSKILAEVGFTSTEHFNYPWVKPPAARETKKRAERRVTSVFTVRKPWCTSNSFVCALLNVLRIPKPAHLRRASILRSKILAEVEFTSTEHFNYPWVKPPAARETKSAPSGARQVKCPADSKTGAFAPYKHFAPAKSWRRANSLRPSILNYPWVEPPAAAKPKNKRQPTVVSYFLVDLKGFEPTTLRMRTVRSRKVVSFLPTDCGVWFDENAGRGAAGRNTIPQFFNKEGVDSKFICVEN